VDSHFQNNFILKSVAHLEGKQCLQITAMNKNGPVYAKSHLKKKEELTG
jgi:hypothetical protein